MPCCSSSSALGAAGLSRFMVSVWPLVIAGVGVGLWWTSGRVRATFFGTERDLAPLGESAFEANQKPG